MDPLRRSAKRIPVDTDGYSQRLRAALVDPDRRAIQLTDFTSSEQGSDLSTPPLGAGVCRLHHFRRDEGPGWVPNPLPIEPASRALGLPVDADELVAATFQSAGCNWRCWYCYVPFEDLTGRRGLQVSVQSMVDVIHTEVDRPIMVDLTGGQPDLTPEWPVWFLQELAARGLDDVYVWSDDNLSTDYLWRYLTPGDLEQLGVSRRYGRACCLKGYNPTSFQFNTKAGPDRFDVQFDLLQRLHDHTNIDFYLYMTFTTPTVEGLAADMAAFVDRLRRISDHLPWRAVPLQIAQWGPVTKRLDDDRRRSLQLQFDVHDAWLEAVAAALGSATPPGPIVDVAR